jgi:hypothetical protein
MSLKKTDLAKQMALKLDGKRKATQIPDRFGKQSTAQNKAAKDAAAVPAPAKLVPVTCRLPAELVQRLREHAQSHPAGIHGLMTEAASLWLTSTNLSTSTSTSPATEASAPPKAPARKTSRKAAP